MRKLLITLSFILLSTLNSFAPMLDEERVNRSLEFEKVVVISKELDINQIGISSIPLNPFIEVDTSQNFKISSKYGYRMHPVLNVVLLHTGIDFIVERNQPIMASGSGQVIRFEYSKYGYGNNIIIKHNDEYEI